MLPAGTFVGGYRVIREIGRGGMATVYEAEDVSLNRVVALKILSRDLAVDDVFRERFGRERKVQAELKHPNIVPVFGGAESEHGLWLAMQLVEGRTLEEVVEEHRPNPEAVWELLQPVGEALEVAHGRGLVHRDISLRNILVADDGTPFLADFGLTKRSGERSLTKSGSVLGTYRYLAPERLRDQAAPPASDVYSLAVVLFRCLCGRFPFEGDDLTLVAGHLFEPPPGPSAFDASLPPALDAVMAKGLAKDPAERYQRPSELITAARASFEDGSAAGYGPRPALGAGAHRPLRLRTRLFAGLALLVFAVGLGTGALAAGGRRAEEHRVRAGSLEVAIPRGWVREKGVVARFPHLQLADPVTLVPAGGRGKEAAIVGMSLTRGKTLLPFSLRPYASNPPATALSLGSLQALRYDGLGPKSKTEPWTVIVSPTSIGVATIACRPGPRRSASNRACERLAGSLKLLDGNGYPVGPSPQLAAFLGRKFEGLNGEMRRLDRRLLTAKGNIAQAAAAAAMADAPRRWARTLAATSVSPQIADRLAGLVTALHFVRDAYKSLAAAYRAESDQAHTAAISEIGLAESILYNRIHYLTGLGYRVAESYP